MKDKRVLMRELTTPRRCSFSDSTNKHRVVLKNPSGNNKVKDDTVDVADDLKDPTPNQSYAENPWNDTNTNNDEQYQNENQKKKIQVVPWKLTTENQISQRHQQVMEYTAWKVLVFGVILARIFPLSD